MKHLERLLNGLRSVWLLLNSPNPVNYNPKGSHLYNHKIYMTLNLYKCGPNKQMLPFVACGFIWSQNVTYPYVYQQYYQNN